MATMADPKYLKDEQMMMKELEEIISGSPREKDFIGRDIYQYQGIWLATMQLQGALACRTHFTAQDSDILIASFPKVGSTWLKALTYALVNRVHHPPHDDDHPLLRNNPHYLSPLLERKVYVDNQVVDLSGLPPPRLFATHLPWFCVRQSVEQGACKVVFICRNPKDTFTSLFHFISKRRTMESMASIQLEEMFEKFCGGVTSSGPYWDYVLDYWRASLETPEKVLFLRFEEMKEEPRIQLRKLAQFLGYPFSRQEEASGVDDQIVKLCSIDNLKSTEVNKNGQLPGSGISNSAFFRRGEVGDWKNLLTPEMAQKLDQITAEKFEPAGLIVAS